VFKSTPSSDISETEKSNKIVCGSAAPNLRLGVFSNALHIFCTEYEQLNKITHMTTIQEFIRALKASSNPPVPGGRTKIEIARHAWDDNTFFLPSKAQVIADWLLSTFLKDKFQSTWVLSNACFRLVLIGFIRSTSSIFNSSHWKLLLDVLTCQGPSVPLSTWLPSLLYRTPLLPVLSVFVAKFGKAGSPVELSTVVYLCVSRLWTLAESKMLLEDLADLFSLILQRIDEGHVTSGIISIGILVTSTYRTSLGNVANKKKVCFLTLTICTPVNIPDRLSPVFPYIPPISLSLLAPCSFALPFIINNPFARRRQGRFSLRRHIRCRQGHTFQS